MTFVDIEKSQNCVDDYLTMFNGPSGRSRPLAHICGDDASGTEVTSTAHMVHVLFRSDASVNGAGFQLLFTSEALQPSG